MLNPGFRGTTEIEARGEKLVVQIDASGRSWALATDLLDCYGLSYAWDGERRRMLIDALDVAPTYRDDAVQADVGWPRFEMSLQAASAPVILVGIIRSSSQGDRAWCRVLEFAEEFGISVRFDPFALGERRGG